MATPARLGGVIGAQSPNIPQLTDYNRAMLQYTTDYFDQYWKGVSALKQFLAEDASGSRVAKWKALPVPRRRSQPRLADGRPVGPLLNVNRYRAVYAANVAQQFDNFMDGINQGQYGVIQYARPLGLELKKILGKGAFGVACLFEFSDMDGIRRNIVVKASTSLNDVSREMAHLKKDRRSRCSHKGSGLVGGISLL
ncbi:hypothetical protein N0V82_002607 [Gnomoniopsis sp. IMI 355080]|nr:hypothetical protein N0V82_002607 [Gnomoniopsis sp. IMI 355080]